MERKNGNQSTIQKQKYYNSHIIIKKNVNKYRQIFYNASKIKQQQVNRRNNTMIEQNHPLLQNINLSQLNTSKSKAMYSFNRATRFPGIKESNPSLYEKPSMLNKRATSFGFGSKSELIDKYQANPSPDKYASISIFEKSPKKGLSIGLGRQDCKHISIYNQSKYPAPTDYTYHEKENSPNYSMRPKVKLPVLFTDTKTPGPGQYVSEHIDKDGMAYNAKYKSFICFKIHQKSPAKIQKQQSPVLGPQTYETIMPSAGKQVLSRHRTEKSFMFDKKPRQTFYVESKAPGPGAYDAFSQFNR